MHNPLDQFFDKILFAFKIYGYEICITYSAISMICATLLIIAGTSRYISKKYKIQNVYVYIIEYIYMFVRNILVEKAGAEAIIYMPFILSIFITILINNLLGLVPGFFTATSQFAINGCLACFVFMYIIFISALNHGLHCVRMFIPSNIPVPILFLITPIEMLMFCIKHVNLCVRLSANMVAGHMVLHTFASLIAMYQASMIIIVPLLMVLFILEIFVACMQAYLFTVLTSTYLHDAIHLH